MDFGIFNLMGSREAEKPTAQVFGEVAEQTRLADSLGYTIAWFAEHHFSNYCLCASPLMMVSHCASITKQIRLGTASQIAVVVLPESLRAGSVMTVEIAHFAERLRPASLHRLIFRDQKPPFLKVIPLNRPVVAVVAHRILQGEDSISELVNLHNCERREAIQGPQRKTGLLRRKSSSQ